MNVRLARLAGWAVLCAGLGLYSWRGIDFSNDITNFLPDGRGAELAEISTQLAKSDLARTMMLTLHADDPAHAIAAAKELAATLRAQPEVAWLRAGADPDFLRGAYELYFPHRLYFLSGDPERELPELLSDASLRARAERTRAQLALPSGALLKRVVPEDPLGAFQRLAERLRAGEPPLLTRDGVFTTPDGRYAVILLATRDAPFDSQAQRPLLDAMWAKFAELRGRLGPDLALETAGVNRFAVAAEAEIKGDFNWISTLSGVGCALLSLIFFRSFLSLALVMVPGFVGLLVAVAVGLLVFGRLDGMTIAFGASLIGVTIDYPTYVLILWSLSPGGESAWSVARRHAGSLTMAALTTIASFGGMAFTSFRGFRELGVFSTVGVAAALIASLVMLPDLLPARRRIQPISEGLARWLEPAILSLHERRGALMLIPALSVALGAIALPRLHWNDDLQAISRPDPVLAAEDERVRERISNFDTGRFVLALGADEDAAVARAEEAYARMQPLIAARKLDGVHALHDLFFPRELQERNLAALRASPELAARVDRAFTAAGFRPGATAPFAAALAAPPPPLTLAELRASPLGELVSSLVLPLGERTAVLTYLRGVHDPEALRAALSGLPDVHVFEQRSFLDEIYGRFRNQTLWLIAIGSAVVLGILAVHYRDWRQATAAFLPSLFVPIIVLSAFAVAGVETNLLHAVSLLLSMGMGVDYGIFIVDSAERGEEFGATLVACILCCLTTVLSFGTLAISSQPPLRAMGITTGAGVLLALALAPVSLLLLRVGPKKEPVHA